MVSNRRKEKLQIIFSDFFFYPNETMTASIKQESAKAAHNIFRCCRVRFGGTSLETAV